MLKKVGLPCWSLILVATLYGCGATAGQMDGAKRVKARQGRDAFVKSLHGGSDQERALEDARRAAGAGVSFGVMEGRLFVGFSDGAAIMELCRQRMPLDSSVRSLVSN